MSNESVDQTRGLSRSTREMFQLLYQELRAIAATRIQSEKPGHTLQATALVHEALLRLIGDRVTWDSRHHFIASASRAMRRILIDAARRKQSIRHGGGRKGIPFTDSLLGFSDDLEQLLELEDALNCLARLDTRAARIVELRVFGGLPFHEIAEVVDVSESTAYREWAFARAWLSSKIRDESLSCQ